MSDIRRLRELDSDPAAQADLALELLKRTADMEVARAALRALGALDVLPADAKDLLRARYAWFDERGERRDAGAFIRQAIVDCLWRSGDLDDIPIFERAVTTYEYLPPGRMEVAHGLRAVGVKALTANAERRATFHAARLLVDAGTSHMSGEPALSAVAVLHETGHLLPLYLYAVHDGPRLPDVLSECLRRLVEIPQSMLPGLVERYAGADDEMVLVGLVDLLLGHEAWAEHVDDLDELVSRTAHDAVFHYAVLAIVASRKRPLIERVIDLARNVRTAERARSLLEALSLLPEGEVEAADLERLSWFRPGGSARAPSSG